MIESLFLPLMLSLAVTQPAASAATPKTQSAPAAKLTAENRAALRCAAAFAIVTQRQSEPTDAVQQAELRTRGREFFVRTLAGLMDEHRLDRAAIEREVRAEAQKLNASGEADKIMPACLLMLQSAGL